MITMVSGVTPIPVVVITDLNFPSDDLQALTLLLGMPEVSVVHILATDGNTWSEEVFENVSAVLLAHKRTDIPVTHFPAPHRFERRSRAFRAYREKSKSFLGPYLKSWQPRSTCSTGAPMRHGDCRPLSSLATAIEVSAPGIVVLSMAPFYPIAELLSLPPDLLGKVRRVVAMAGNFPATSRVPPKADFNVWFDPHSANAVFESGLEISLLPRNACNSCVLDWETLSRMDTGEPWARQFLADVAGMLAQHGSDFPLIDTILPLLLVEPDLVTKCRTGIVYVRRKPLRISGKTYFRERPDGNVTLIDELDPGRVRDSLLRRVADFGIHGTPFPACSGGSDFRIRSWLGQRLFDRPFYRIDVNTDIDREAAVKHNLDLEELDSLYRRILELASEHSGQTFAGYQEATLPQGADRYFQPTLSRLVREAALISRLIQVDAVATWNESDGICGFACLSVPAKWRCLEFSRRFGARVAEGDAIVELAYVSPGVRSRRVLESMHAALISWWLQECDTRRVRPGRFLAFRPDLTTVLRPSQDESRHVSSIRQILSDSEYPEC